MGTKQVFKYRDNDTDDILDSVAGESIVSGDKANLKLDVLSSPPSTLEDGDVWMDNNGGLSTRVGGTTRELPTGGEVAANKNAVDGYPGLDTYAIQLKNSGGVQIAGAVISLIQYNIDAANPITFSLQQNADVETDQAGTIPVMQDIVAGDKANVRLDILPVATNGGDPTTQEDGDVWLVDTGVIRARIGATDYEFAPGGEQTANKNASGGYPGLDVYKLQLKNSGGAQSAGAIISTLTYDIDAATPISFALQQNADVETDAQGTVPVMRDIVAGAEANLCVDVLSADPTAQADGDLWLLDVPGFWARVGGTDYGTKLFEDPEVVDFTEMSAGTHQGGQQTISASGTVGPEQLVLASNTINVTLPTPSTAIAGREYVIVNTDTGVITITNTVSGTSSRTLSSQWNYIRVQCDATTWYMVGTG